MAAIELPQIAPDLREPLTPESWEAYRRSLDRWCSRWDAIDEDQHQYTVSDQLSDSSRTLLRTFVHHPDLKGKSYDHVINELRRSARHAQALYKSRIKYSKPGPATDADRNETRAANVATIQWGFFGGSDWEFMNAREIADLSRRFAVPGKASEPMDYGREIEINHDVLATNHFGYLLNQEVRYGLGKQDKMSLKEHLEDLEEGKRYPNETNIAQWVRRSRPKAVGLGVAGLFAGAATGIGALTLLGGLCIVFFAASFVAYPWLLAPE